jgi:hypothetical protein
MAINKKCSVCGKDFAAKNDKGIYCSDSCKMKAHRKRKKERKDRENELDLEKSEVYADFIENRLTHFENQLLLFHKDMEVLIKYTIEASVLSAKIPLLKERISDLSDDFQEFKRDHQKFVKDVNEKVEKNTENIKLIAFHFDNLCEKVNSMNGNKITDTLGSVLENDKIMDAVSTVIKNQFKSKERN